MINVLLSIATYLFITVAFFVGALSALLVILFYVFHTKALDAYRYENLTDDAVAAPCSWAAPAPEEWEVSPQCFASFADLPDDFATPIATFF